MSDKYKRVSCDLYDRFEILATFKKKVTITYQTAAEETITEETVIKTLVTRDKAEYLVTASGVEVRLDRLVSVVEIGG